MNVEINNDGPVTIIYESQDGKFYEQNRCLVNTTWPKNWLTLVVVIAFILFIILLFMFLNQGDEDTGQITITENAELRTGPNAAYPIIYKIEKVIALRK